MAITVQPVFGAFDYDAADVSVEEVSEEIVQRPVLVALPRSDRARDGDGYLQQRLLTLRGRLGGASTSQQDLRTILDAFGYAHRPGRRKFYRDTDRYLRDVQVDSDTLPDDTGLVHRPFSVRLVAADPFWYRTTLDTDAWSPATGDTKVFANGGGVNALPSFSLTPGAGTLDLDLYNDSLLPGAPTLTGAGTGGSLAAATYWVKLAWLLRDGETVPGTADDATTTGSTSKITIAHGTAPEDARGYYVYAGTGASEPALSAMYLQHTYGAIPIGKDFVLRSLITSGTPGTTPTLGVIRIDGTTAANDVIVIDCDRQIVTRNADLALSYFGGTFWPLLPGNNTLRAVYSGATLGAIATEWRERWL